MQRILTLALMMVAFTISMYAQPQIEIIGGDEYNWGSVKPSDSPLKAKVKIKNVGNQLLKVDKVKPSCGCTTAPLDKDQLKPGETATIDIKFNISSRPGHTSKTIRIHSNDPKNPTKILRLKAEVFVPIVVQPSSNLRINNLKVGYETVATAKIKNVSKSVIKLKNYKFSPSNVEGVVTNLKKNITLKPNEEFDLIARIKPVKSGYFQMTIIIETDNKDLNEIKIYARKNVEKSDLFND